MKTFSILICTFGSSWWRDLAISRALPSAQTQGDNEIILVHDPDPNAPLGPLRNRAADMASSDFIVFVDGDDELESGYIDAMRKGSADIMIPRVRVLCEGPNETPMPAPFEIPTRPLLDGNYAIVGSPIRRDLFLSVGGYPNLEYAEDWGMILAAWISAATFEHIPQATYRQHWRKHSRNQHPDGEILRQNIRDHYTPLAQRAGLLS